MDQSKTDKQHKTYKKPWVQQRFKDKVRKKLVISSLASLANPSHDECPLSNKKRIKRR